MLSALSITASAWYLLFWCSETLSKRKVLQPLPSAQVSGPFWPRILCFLHNVHDIACFSRSNLSHDHPLFLTSWKPHLCPAFAAVDFSSSGGFAFFAGLIPKYESSVELRFFPGMVQKIMILFCRSTTTQQNLFLTSVL